jgi:hypothetical protein
MQLGDRRGTSADWLSIWLQEELKKRALDAKWTPLKGKKELVDRLQVLSGPPPSHLAA